jgi:hypothetical protein
MRYIESGLKIQLSRIISHLSLSILLIILRIFQMRLGGSLWHLLPQFTGFNKVWNHTEVFMPQFDPGMGYSWFSFSRVYYFKDVLDLSPSRAQTLVAATMTPWNIKVLDHI